MFTPKIMPPKCTPLSQFQNCLVYTDVNQELPSRENCTIKHTLIGNKLQEYFYSSMTEYAWYVVTLVTSHEVLSHVNQVPKKIALLIS